MIIDWPKFLPALFLLLLPIGLFHGKKTQVRPITRDWHGEWGQILKHVFHWADLARAVGGAWLLNHSLSGTPDALGIWRYLVPFTVWAVLISAVALQTFVCKEPDSSLAPFTFVIGLAFGYFPPLIVILPVLAAVTVAAGASTAGAFFPVLAVAMMIGVFVSGIGLTFQGKSLIVPAAIGFCFSILPWLLSIMFSRDMVIALHPSPKTEHSASELPPHR